jgi:hypothetical protein
VAVSYAQDLDERVQVVVERTLADQGLQLQVQDPGALHAIAQHVLAAGDRS